VPVQRILKSEKGTKMRRLLTIATSVVFFAALGLAETWTGQLFDATCVSQQKSVQSCTPTSSTTAFLVVVSGKAYKLDEAGNTKAMAALKNRADRTAPGAPATSTAVAAKISGTAQGDTIMVDTIQVQ
jgi:hypothetical protein